MPGAFHVPFGTTVRGHSIGQRDVGDVLHLPSAPALLVERSRRYTRLARLADDTTHRRP